MRQKVCITPAEMLVMREEGLSNRDIANILDISYATVLRYIGKQEGRMDSLAAFKDTPKVKEVKEVKHVEETVPKYEPKPIEETYLICGMDITLDRGVAGMYIRTNDGAEMQIPYESVPELVQFLVWAMRERMEVQEDGSTE